MKLQFNLLLLLSLLVITPVMVGCKQNSSDNESAQMVKNEMKVNIPIEGMSCMSCVANVRKTLSNMDGVTEVKVSLQDKNATVTFVPEKASTEQLQKAINQLGYKAGNPQEIKE
jgi:copper ion binding protein